MIKVFLSDRDTEYGKALALAISSLHSEFEIRLLHSETDFNQCDLLLDQYDVFLLGGYTDHEIESLKICSLNKSKVVILTEYQVEDITKQTEQHSDCYWYLYKYVKINKVITDLNYIIGFISGKKSFMRRSLHTNIIGFYSISGGVGKSVISIGTSRELTRYHDKKVLYLNFEEIPATELYVKYISNNRNVGDYLYYLLERQNEILCSHLNGFVAIDEFGVEFFPSSKGRNDLNYLSKEELIYLIKVLSDSCRYDYIIFDMNNNLSEETLALMEQCSQMLLVQNNSPVSIYKSNKLLDFLNEKNIFEQNRILAVINKTDHLEMDVSYINQKQEMNCLTKIYIERDEGSFQVLNNQLEININHSFGVGIKQIADEILLSDNKNQKSYSNSTVLNN